MIAVVVNAGQVAVAVMSHALVQVQTLRIMAMLAAVVEGVALMLMLLVKVGGWTR